MGAPPSDEQIADMLSNPMIAQTMNEALNNDQFIDYMIRSNPTLAGMPNAREMLRSPYFRNMMTNPEALRMAARMRRMFQGGGNAAFPAPGTTDNTAASPAQPEGSAATGQDDLLRSLFGAAGGAPFGSPTANPLASLFGMVPPGGTPGAAGATPAAGAAPTSSNQPATSTGTGGASTGTGANTQGQAGTGAQPVNPFAALFGGMGQGNMQGGQGLNPFAFPPPSPEAMQQLAQLWGAGAPAQAAPPDNRPPEERYAEQLRQLNDMGFFDFDRNVEALRRSGGSVQGAIEHLLSGS